MQKWNERLFEEMHTAFLQNRADRDPADGWYEGELWFFDNYVIPLAGKLRECGVFGVSSDELMTFAEQNRHEWERKGRSVVEDMKRNSMKAAVKAGIHKSKAAMESVQEMNDSYASSNSREEVNIKQEAETETAEPNETFDEECSRSSGSSWGRREVVVPAGKLGIVVDATQINPVVVKVSPESPLTGQLLCGDVIVAVDGVSTRSLDASAFALLLSLNSDSTRKMTIERASLKDDSL